MFIRNADDVWASAISDKRTRQRRDVPIVRPDRIAPLLATHAFYTAAPLYMYAGVSYSLPDQFEIEAGQQDRLVVDYRRDLISGLGNWGHYLEAMPLDVWESFSHYMLTSGFFSVGKRIAWFVAPTPLRIADISKPGEIVSTAQIVLPITVFLPTGNRGKLVLSPGMPVGSPATLSWNKADDNVVEAAEKLLSRKGRIDRGE